MSNGRPSPNGYSSDTRSNGYASTRRCRLKQRHTISFQAYGTHRSSKRRRLCRKPFALLQRIVHHRVTNVAAGDRYDSFERQAHAGGFGRHQHCDRQRRHLGAREPRRQRGARRRQRHLQRVVRRSSGAAATPRALADPERSSLAALRLQRARSAYGSAPGEEPSNSSSISLRVGYTHRAARRQRLAARSTARCKTACCCRST